MWKQVPEKATKILEKFVEIDWWTRSWKERFGLQRKNYRKLPIKTWAEKQEILIVDKGKGMLEKEDRPTKHILKILHTLNTQRNNKQTSHQAISGQINSEKFEDSYFSYNYLMLT